MEADVPIGLFLSGGTDSSLVAGLMAENSNKPIRTFSIIFNDKKFNEAEYALRMAKICGSDHMQIEVNPENLEILPKLIYQLEEPFANASSLISFLVSQAAREYVKVALNGDGGDEKFAGYDRYLRVDRDGRLWPYRRFLRSAAGLMPKKYQTYARSLGEKYAEKYLSYNQYFSGPVTNYEPAWRWYEKCFQNPNALSWGDKVIAADTSYYLSDDLLAKADLTAMAVGLEGRSPFLDYKFVEMAAQIPFELKVKNGILKYILKKAAEKYVPKENLYRKKMGFSVPLAEWFTGNLNKYARSVILSKKAVTRKLFNLDYVSEMLATHSVTHDFGPKLWNLLVLELWFRRFFPSYCHREAMK
jgi:asparagine synthase (glutamine-hydrolysing)